MDKIYFKNGYMAFVFDRLSRKLRVIKRNTSCLSVIAEASFYPFDNFII